MIDNPNGKLASVVEDPNYEHHPFIEPSDASTVKPITPESEDFRKYPFRANLILTHRFMIMAAFMAYSDITDKDKLVQCINGVNDINTVFTYSVADIKHNPVSRSTCVLFLNWLKHYIERTLGLHNHETVKLRLNADECFLQISNTNLKIRLTINEDNHWILEGAI